MIAAGKAYGRGIKAAGPHAVWLDLGAHIGLCAWARPCCLHALSMLSSPRSFAVAALTGGAKHVYSYEVRARNGTQSFHQPFMQAFSVNAKQLRPRSQQRLQAQQRNT